MRVRVIYFQSARKLRGLENETIELESGARVADLVTRLRQNTPALEPLIPSLLFAVNKEHAPRDHALSDGDEIAVMPPFSGG